MQVVGKIQAVAPSALGGRDRVIAVLDAWAKRKFTADTSGGSIINRSQTEALVDRRDEAVEDMAQSSFEVLEPVPGGQLRTYVRVLSKADVLHFNCTLSISVDGGLAPPNIDLHIPRFVREIIALDLGWRASPTAEGVAARVHNIGPDGVDTFLQLLEFKQRRLPLVVVSEFEGETLAGDLDARLAADLCGLGHVVRLSAAAAWEITERLGKEWSVYNGAVRLFWPFRANKEQYRNHPLWTYDSLTRRDSSAIEARDRVRSQLRERLLEASAFLSDDRAMDQFLKAGAAAAKGRANDRDGDPIELLRQEIVELREHLDQRDRQIETLNANVETLTIALRSRPAESADALEEPPPETVREALDIARSRHGDVLAFGDQLDETVTTLEAEAGPPDKVLRYLDTLADLSRALEAGPLGNTIPIWLRDMGVEASGESRTTRASRAEQKRRTFSIQGQQTYCELHAKPSDGVAPPLCVRIYFATADTSPRVRIGYLGKHFD
jgi:hypothetical protein